MPLLVPLLEFVQPLDVLLYRPSSLAGWMIAIKTWNKQTSHVEVVSYKSTERIETFTARGTVSQGEDRKSGVQFYGDLASRVDRITYVLRPKREGRANAAYLWALTQAVGQGYDYVGLAVFALAAAQGSATKMHCGEAVTRYLRHADLYPFHHNADADLIAPATFLFSTSFVQYRVMNGNIDPSSGV